MNAYRDKLVEAMARAMRGAQIRDDEGSFPSLFDMLDFSGENKAHTVVNALAAAALDAALGVLAEPSAEIVEAGGEAALEAYGSASGFITMEDAFGAGLRAMLATLGDV